ncbi:MAG: Eco57I restriction-modification methylase domain-containing protein, partial [Thermoplasmata archaeon]
ASNIKCGNSLIGPDFYESGQMDLLDEEEQYRINVFDWNTEFAEIMKAGGFDAIIGNPPYVLLQDEFRDDKQLSYYRSEFSAASYKIDTYHLFMEKGVKLTRTGGRCSMITPANYLTNNYLLGLRRLILENSLIDHILVIDGGVFFGISVDNAVFVVTPGESTGKTFPIIHAQQEGENLNRVSEIVVSTHRALSDKYVLFTGTSDKTFGDLLEHVSKKSVKLGEIAHVNFGKQLRDRKKFTTDVIQVSDLPKLKKPYKPCYTGRDVSRFIVEWNYLACFDNEVARRGGCWDADRQNAKNKLLTRQIGKYPEFAMDQLGYQCLNTIFMVNIYFNDLDPLFVLGLLNSKLTRVIWVNQFYDQRRTFPKIKGTYLMQLPIYNIDFSDKIDKAHYNRIVKLVERMLDLHKRLVKAKTTYDKTNLQHQIDATDQQIDHLVYELYDLTDKEIEIIEGK